MIALMISGLRAARPDMSRITAMSSAHLHPVGLGEDEDTFDQALGELDLGTFARLAQPPDLMGHRSTING